MICQRQGGTKRKNPARGYFPQHKAETTLQITKLITKIKQQKLGIVFVEILVNVSHGMVFLKNTVYTKK